MKITTKIVIWTSVALVLAGGAVGIYFLAKPKEGQTRTKKDKNQTYKDGKWVDDVPSEVPIPMPNGGGGGTGGRKSCYKEQVEKLQTILKKEGASIDVDGCMGTQTKSIMEEYGYSLSGGKILKTSRVEPAKGLGLWTATNSVNIYGAKKLQGGVIDVDLTKKSKLSKSDVFIGAIMGFKTLTYGSLGSMQLIIVVDNKGDTVYVQNEKNVISKKTVEV
jgi:hypothetical protein